MLLDLGVNDGKIRKKIMLHVSRFRAVHREILREIEGGFRRGSIASSSASRETTPTKQRRRSKSPPQSGSQSPNGNRSHSGSLSPASINNQVSPERLIKQMKRKQSQESNRSNSTVTLNGMDEGNSEDEDYVYDDASGDEEEEELARELEERLKYPARLLQGVTEASENKADTVNFANMMGSVWSDLHRE